MAQHAEVLMPHSKMKESIAQILKDEGYISNVSVEGAAGTPVKQLKLSLKYQGRRNVIAGLKQVSTPGLRRYVCSTEIPRVLGGLGVAILSTPKGIMSDSQARKQHVGGELVCYVW
ncbi:MAG TPA: 30S ribosomal protein S8 [Candidatus Limnocylindria bacterium]|nr:30S ribosomal protein S8 [Candidatus Limnocylindria bacterium]